jgi:hypothetical protein
MHVFVADLDGILRVASGVPEKASSWSWQAKPAPSLRPGSHLTVSGRYLFVTDASLYTQFTDLYGSPTWLVVMPSDGTGGGAATPGSPVTVVDTGTDEDPHLDVFVVDNEDGTVKCLSASVWSASSKTTEPVRRRGPRPNANG